MARPAIKRDYDKFDALPPEVKKLHHEYGYVPPSTKVIDVEWTGRVMEAIRIAKAPRELRTQKQADKAYKLLSWYFRSISHLPEIVALLEPLKPPMRRRRM